MNPLSLISSAALGPIKLVTGLVSGIERMVNSSEHNFKKDLDSLLEQAGVPESERGKIKDLLNSGRDQDIGRKLQALMSAGIIPAGLSEQIGALAQQNGVPTSSVNSNDLATPIDDKEMVDYLLGQAFREG